MFRQYSNSNERLEIFLTCFCNILCYLGTDYKLEFMTQKFKNLYLSLYLNIKFTEPLKKLLKRVIKIQCLFAF